MLGSWQKKKNKKNKEIYYLDRKRISGRGKIFPARHPARGMVHNQHECCRAMEWCPERGRELKGSLRKKEGGEGKFDNRPGAVDD